MAKTKKRTRGAKEKASEFEVPGPSQRGLLSSTDMYRVYLSENLTLNGEGGYVNLRGVDGGLPGARQAEVRSTNSTDMIIAHIGTDRSGHNAIFLVRVPRESQIFNPDTSQQA
jgi:hypothetical protein